MQQCNAIISFGNKKVEISCQSFRTRRLTMEEELQTPRRRGMEGKKIHIPRKRLIIFCLASIGTNSNIINKIEKMKAIYAGVIGNTIFW